MRRLIIVFVCLVLGSLTACTALKQPSEKEKRNVSEMTSNMRTWALGRGLIDLPANWSGGGDVKLYYGLGADHASVEVRVLGEGVTRERFDAAIRERASRIAAVKNDEMNDIPMLVSARADTPQSAMLQYYMRKTQRQTFVHELHLLVDDAYVMLRADSFKGNTAPVEARLSKLSREIFKIAPRKPVQALPWGRL